MTELMPDFQAEFCRVVNRILQRSFETISMMALISSMFTGIGSIVPLSMSA
jgi:hypothetical protein